LLRIAARNLRRQARHSAFALVAIVFGVTGLALADGFVRDVFFQLGEATVRAQLGHLQLARPGFRDAGAGRPEEFLIERPEPVRAALAGDPRVETVAARLYLSGLASAGKREMPVEVEGIEPIAEAGGSEYLRLLEGVGLAAAGPNAALLGEGAARELGVRAGDYVNLTAPTLDGSLNAGEFQVAGVFRSFSKDYDARAMRIPLAQAQDLIQAAGVNTLVVHLVDTADTDAVLHRLREGPETAGLDVQPWHRLSDFYANTRELYARQFGILQLIAVVLIGVSVQGSMNVTVFERTAEFGTMRALGARSSQVFALLATEAALLGAAGAVIGVAVALGAGSLISWVGIPMPPPPNAESGFTARILLSMPGLGAAAAVGALAALLGALTPAWRVRRLSIVAALGHRV
jgi:putative ABC transport system permease protein